MGFNAVATSPVSTFEEIWFDSWVGWVLLLQVLKI